MAVQQSIPRVTLGGRALLLGPSGDIAFPDVPTVLLHVEPGSATDPVVVAAAASGTAVVVTGEPAQNEEARRAARDLLARSTELAGSGSVVSAGPVGSVVVEVPVGPSVPPITAAWVAEVMSDGLLVGAALSADDAGAEIGLLTQVLSAGVCLVRGADPVRFRRVRAVVEALSLASTTGSRTTEAGEES